MANTDDFPEIVDDNWKRTCPLHKLYNTPIFFSLMVPDQTDLAPSDYNRVRTSGAIII